MVGEIPNEAARWQRRHNYYLNCLRDVDRSIAVVLAELEASGLADRTIVVLTADHGDMDGAHQLHAKGAVAYREQNQVPLLIAHPSFEGGRECRAVTSHVDLAPTRNTGRARRKMSWSASVSGRPIACRLAQLRTGAMLKPATPSVDAISSASAAGNLARERSRATTLNRHTGRLSAKVMLRLFLSIR
jgi:hypothetical protein